MRIKKLVVISFLIGSSSGAVFSQAAKGQQAGASEQFFRARKVELAQAGSEDPLVEILRRKQAELDALDAAKKPATPAAASAHATPEKKDRIEVAPAPVAPSISKPAAQVEAPKVAVPTESAVSSPKTTADEDRLVEILRKKQAELDAKTPTAAPAEVAKKAKAAPVQKPVVNAEAESKEREESEKRIRRIEAEIKAKEAAMKQAAEAKTAAPVVKADAKKKDAVSKAEPKAKASKTPTAPAPDLSTKEGRLAELLRKYKADEITPRDYHLQRAKIIAEP